MSELIVKDNALIQASYTLDTVEQRLILLAIAEARETGHGITENSLLEVHASSYINTFNVEKHTAYTVLRDASKSLFDRYVTYHDINPKTGKDRSFHCRWVDKIGYEPQSGIVFLRFTQDIVPLITRLEENFTKYELEQVSRLTSSYAIRLYELLIQWRSAGKTPIFDLSIFRQQLGVEAHQYKTMSNFKTYVLDFALKQVNELTDITAKYEQHKKGRSISGFSFSFKQKKTNSDKVIKETDTLALFSKMSDKQRHLFANKLSELPEMGRYSEGTESYQQFAVRIAEMLQDSQKFQELFPYLQKVGFASA
ncbi:RepB family plasmid replication initiator protein [Acinetobacter baumannii]|jgi:plasmid replication initiation protein|uniref:replication initiation protein RepM n=1 Tax=Acinetobacter TaxID=469 RepID=UPI000D39811F|nr:MULTISPECIES: replication initiation protein RepM [Acinetobacter]EHU2205106.1 replication initiation protein [Acinetobacter baumannii]EHU2221133.1 replication initiation protein [Acinetobacter baumannii]EHU2393453.1 replication initiation protein [Acinetobacter baumannii]EHU2599869.1 replication initiation protein [Acinetobacter baumannii]EHU2789339.1 replication initiation protein [Acinetobacter baumannii]